VNDHPHPVDSSGHRSEQRLNIGTGPDLDSVIGALRGIKAKERRRRQLFAACGSAVLFLLLAMLVLRPNGGSVPTAESDVVAAQLETEQTPDVTIAVASDEELLEALKGMPVALVRRPDGGRQLLVLPSGGRW
jgi:hypothetical protein